MRTFFSLLPLLSTFPSLSLDFDDGGISFFICCELSRFVSLLIIPHRASGDKRVGHEGERRILTEGNTGGRWRRSKQVTQLTHNQAGHTKHRR